MRYLSRNSFFCYFLFFFVFLAFWSFRKTSKIFDWTKNENENEHEKFEFALLFFAFSRSKIWKFEIKIFNAKNFEIFQIFGASILKKEPKCSAAVLREIPKPFNNQWPCKKSCHSCVNLIEINALALERNPSTSEDSCKNNKRLSETHCQTQSRQCFQGNIRNFQCKFKNLQGKFENFHGNLRNFQGDFRNFRGKLKNFQGTICSKGSR